MKRMLELLSFSVWAVCTLRYWFPRLFAGLVLGFGLVALVLALALSGCGSSRQVADQRHNASIQAPLVGLASDTTRTALGHVSGVTPHNVTGSKPSLPARLTDAIGLSTPEGRARRQARKDAAASVPRKLGKGAVYAWNADVVNGYKNDAAVIKADSGATVTAIGKAKAPVASAPHATATQTVEKPGFLSVLAAAALRLWWLWLLLALYFCRKSLPVVGRFFA